MIWLNSFLQRAKLAEIVNRWMVDRLEPTDVGTLKRLVNYNCYLARFVLHDVASYLCEAMAGTRVESRHAYTKGMLKDFLVERPAYTNERIDRMIARYRRYPQDFYRETPFDGRIYVTRDAQGERYLGSTRRKRFKRIAEKASRRVIDHVFEHVKEEAEALAQQRAERLGVPIHKLITPEQQQLAEFVHAEHRIIKRLRVGSLLDDFPQFQLNDIFGVKALCEDGDVPRLTSLVEAHPRMDILEAELHSGSYNALNITLRYRIDRDRLLETPPHGEALEVLARRGLSAAEIIDGYRQFLCDSEDDLVMEVIAAGYQELLESEIGRSIHEERVLDQRSQQQYHSSLARNIAALIEYMMALRRYPTDAIDDIPIKLWIKYMPDYFESVLKATYNVTETIYLD